MKSERIKNIVIILMAIALVGLVIGVIYLGFKNEYLEDRYDDLEDRYEYLDESNKYNNGSSNSNEVPNTEDNSTNNSTPSKENNISKDEALKIVLNDLKISQQDITDLDIELEYKLRYQMNVYEISFDYNHLEYEYYLNPLNGKILDTFKSLD